MPVLSHPHNKMCFMKVRRNHLCISLCLNVQIKGVPWTNPAGHNLPGAKCKLKYSDVPA